MRSHRAATRLLLTVVLATAATQARAADGILRLTDRDGVVHLTNVPADPRYQRLAGASGTVARWLRLPPRTWARYADDIREIARRHGVSAALVEAVIRVESGFDRTAVSPKGAGGLMQLMPETAQSLGVANRFDAQANITGGVRHLRHLLDRYHGDVALALAAYNAGEAAVDAHRGVPPFPETQQYVAHVLRLVGGADAARRSRVLYRSVAPDGTPTYSNFLPPAHARR